MELNGKCKVEFEKWYDLNYRDYQVWESCLWDDMPLPMKYGILKVFFVRRGNIYINISNEFYKDGVNTLWQVFKYDSNKGDYLSDKSSASYGDNGDYALDDAMNKSIKFANNLYNE